MRKRIASLFLTLCLLCGLLPAGAMAFSDIKDEDTAVAAAVLQSMGITEGTSASTFAPDEKLTRAQFCAFAVRAMGLEDSAGTHSYKSLFSDVKPGSWYTGYVNLAYTDGVINGYGNGYFGPNDTVTYGQVVTILLRLLGYSSAQVGKVWPIDYINYAHELEIDDGVSLSANSTVTRADAAKLIYNTVRTEKSGSSIPYCQTISTVASTQTAIVLDGNASSGGASGQLMVCSVGAAGASIEYFVQKNKVPAELNGYLGTLLLSSAGKAVGFVPDSSDYADITISSAKASGITDASGRVYRVSGSATVIFGAGTYAYGSSGYIQVDGQSGKNARLYYNDAGGVSYVYISSGTTGVSTDAAVADKAASAGALASALGVTATGYSISKNGAPAENGDIAALDTAYYDAASKTLCVSDYRLTGYIEAASPSLDAAESITVAGCKLGVLECAWDTLGDFELGKRVTLLLTDDCKVAAAVSTGKATADMIGVLAPDGGSVTLCGSGLVIKGDTIKASGGLAGTLVKASASLKNELTVTEYSEKSQSGSVNIPANRLGSYDLAPGCAIYEWTGTSSLKSYVYSLSGQQGKSSSDLTDIYWTSTLPASSVSSCHINSAGQVDILLLKDVTGNCYQYGKLTAYTGYEGINLSTSVTDPSYNRAAGLTNSVYPSGSQKYLCTMDGVSGYGGISLGMHSTGYGIVASAATLKSVSKVASGSFYEKNDDWFVTVAGTDIPVSDSVQVYLASVGTWLGGEDGLLTAISSGLSLTVYYDRTLTTGAQARIIVAETN